MPTYLTIRQISERLSVAPETVRYWITTGKLPGFKPGRQVLVRESDLQAMIERSALEQLRNEGARVRKADAR